MNTILTIFTDGSSRGNPGPGGWGAVIVSGSCTEPVGDEKNSAANDDATVVELGGREDRTTNNRMELLAAIEALAYVSGHISKKIPLSISVNTDSSYVINGITKWVHGWIRKNWITSQKEEVMNRDLWQRLVEAVSTAEKMSGTGTKISWNYVGGHAGVVGNERCDVIATSFADNDPAELFSGKLADYSLKNILSLSEKSAKKSQKSRSKAAAYSYVSAVGGLVKTHKTWAECEARVKGAQGARYKKALSVGDEADIIKDFGDSKRVS